MTWSASAYLAFEAERTRPVRDLLAAVKLVSPARVVDLGCGPGNSTEALQARFPDAAILALDSAPDMVAAARARLASVELRQADIRGWADGGAGDPPFDLIFANAVLQWVPDHALLLPRLLRRLRPGGVLAVQVPDHYDEPPHRLMRAIAAEPEFAAASKGDAVFHRHAPHWYYATLRDAGAEVEMWRTTYFHRLAGGAEAIVTWFAATGLRPFLEALPPEARPAYLARLRSDLAATFPAAADGTVLLPFPRLFLVGRTAADGN